MRNGRSVLLASMVVAALALAGCADEVECGAGTRAEGDRCVAICDPGTEVDPATGRCVSTCVEGTQRDEASGACMAYGSACVSGQFWDDATAACVEIASLCSDPTVWVASEGRCVSRDALRTADLTEGEGENDPRWGGPTAFERLELPAVGESVTISGTISEPVDRGGNAWLDPDWDLWVFEATEPVLLRVTADGIGGATSGFQILNVDSGHFVTRLDVGTTSATARRDLFLPRAGLYGLAATDGLNLATSGDPGPHHGGGDFGYFIEVERLPIPQPTPITTTMGYAQFDGVIPPEPPADGSTTVRFFSVPVSGKKLYVFEPALHAYTGFSALSVLDGDRFAYASHRGFFNTFVNDTTATVVVDLEYSFDPVDVGFSVTLLEETMTWFDGSLPTKTLVQKEWTPNTQIEQAIFQFETGAREVAEVRVTSSTGATCFTALDGHVAWELDKIGCSVGVSVEEGDLRFFAPSAGAYTLATFDWLGAKVSNGFVYEIPRHNYEVTAEVVRRPTREVGAVAEPWSAQGEALSAAQRERYYLLSPEPGATAFWGELTTTLSTEVAQYTTAVGPFDADSRSRSSGFALRSPDGAPIVVGVRDSAGAAGSYDIRIEPLPVAELGMVRMGSALEVTETIQANSARRFIRIEAEKMGLLQLEITPPAGVDLALETRDLFLGPLHEAAVDLSGAGEAETAYRAVAFQGAFFEVVTADGQPVSADTSFSIRAMLYRPTIEAEPNNSPELAQPLTLPAAVSSVLRGEGDRDTFRIELAEPSTLVVETLPTGDPYDAWITNVTLADASGRIVATDQGTGQGALGRLRTRVAQPGVYFVSVDAGVRAGFYLLDVTATPL